MANSLKPESQSRTFFSSSLMLDFLFWEFCPDIHSFAIYQALHHFRYWEHKVPILGSSPAPGVINKTSHQISVCQLHQNVKKEKSSGVREGWEPLWKAVREDPPSRKHELERRPGGLGAGLLSQQREPRANAPGQECPRDVQETTRGAKAGMSQGLGTF